MIELTCVHCKINAFSLETAHEATTHSKQLRDPPVEERSYKTHMFSV